MSRYRHKLVDVIVRDLEAEKVLKLPRNRVQSSSDRRASGSHPTSIMLVCCQDP